MAERIVIEEEQGNLQRAAARLGVTDRALQMDDFAVIHQVVSLASTWLACASISSANAAAMAIDMRRKISRSSTMPSTASSDTNSERAI